MYKYNLELFRLVPRVGFRLSPRLGFRRLSGLTLRLAIRGLTGLRRLSGVAPRLTFRLAVER